MKVNKTTFLLLAGLGSALGLHAQEGKSEDELNAEIAVVKPYNPSISDAFKINKQPSNQSEEAKKLDVSYGISTSPLTMNFKLSPINPPKIKRTPVDKLYSNLVRVGVGNDGNHLAELLLNNKRSNRGAYGLHLYQLGSKGNIPETNASNYSYSGLSVYGKKFFSKYSLSGEVQAGRDQVRYYGSTVQADSIEVPKQQYLTFGSGLQFRANKPKDQVFFDIATLDYLYMRDLFNRSEHQINLSTEVSSSTKEGMVLADLGADYITSTSDSSQQDFVSGTVGMRIEGNSRKWNYLFGAKASMLADISGKSQSLFFYPNIDLQYNVLQDFLIAYAGLKGGLEARGMNQLRLENPFLNTSDSIRFSNHRIVVESGLKGRISTGSNYHFGVRYSKIEDFAFYQLNQDNALSTNTFNLLYDDVNRFQFFGELGFALSKKLHLNARADVLAFTTDNLLKAYNQPNMRGSLMARYSIQSKIFLNTEWFYVGQRYVDNVRQIDGYVDGNLGLEYKYSNNLSAFVNLNNLLGKNYLLWEDYQSQGFNVLGGFTYKF